MNEIVLATRPGPWDRWGAFASSACAVHCLLSPLLFLSLPSIANVWAHPASHALLLLAVVPLALTVLWRGYRKHGEHWVIGAALLGLGFVLVGAALPYLSGAEAGHAAGAVGHECAHCCPTVVTDDAGQSRLSFPPGSVASIVGSVFLVGAHLGNRRSCRRCP